ncbi:MAG: hypothetical protein ACRDZ1_04715 [Acidimicrobiia bacterium]
METLVYYLPTAACVGGMMLCMFMMSRGRSSGEQAAEKAGTPAPVADDEVARLREEVDALRAELGAREAVREPAS